MMTRTIVALLLLICAVPAFSETAQEQYISYIVTEEAKGKFALNESISVDMFQQWLALGDDSKEFDVHERIDSLLDENSEASVICATALASLDILFCYIELSNMTSSLLEARMKWLIEQGYDVQKYSDAHEAYSEIMCTGLVDLDYGDMGNNYSHITYLSCSLDYMKSFMNFLSSFHVASFR